MADSVQDLISDAVGHPVVSRDATGTVGTASVELFRQDPRRCALVIYNLSTGVIFARPRDPASSTAGFRIGPGMGLQWLWRDDYDLPVQAWNIVGDAAGLAYYAVQLLLRG